MRWRWLLILGVAILAADGAACKGLGVLERMDAQEQTSAAYSRIHLAVFVIALALLALRKISWRTAALVGALLLIHPSWTMSSYGGDCGYVKRDMTMLFFWMICSVVAWTILSKLFWERARSKKGLG